MNVYGLILKKDRSEAMKKLEYKVIHEGVRNKILYIPEE